jgi:hypothetical protein
MWNHMKPANAEPHQREGGGAGTDDYPKDEMRDSLLAGADDVAKKPSAAAIISKMPGLATNKSATTSRFTAALYVDG